MKVVIDISENDYWLACNYPETLIGVYAQAIKNGTPLPKGHGRLIDADVVDDNIYDLTRSMDLNYGQIIKVVDDAPTIIESDGGGEDGAETR